MEPYFQLLPTLHSSFVTLYDMVEACNFHKLFDSLDFILREKYDLQFVIKVKSINYLLTFNGCLEMLVLLQRCEKIQRFMNNNLKKNQD